MMTTQDLENRNPQKLLRDNSGRTYQILGILGRGGFGVVYLARSLNEAGLARDVAIKVMNVDIARQDEFAGRFRDEARILGFLQSRSIVTVLDLVRIGDEWAVIMEYVAGADLGVLLERGPIPVRPALEIVREAACALRAAHEARDPQTNEELGIIHRDIKPANIRLTRSGEIRVLDFGVARAHFEQREALTRSIAFGSVGYLAPERIEGQDLPAADIYALGVVLYECLSRHKLGQLPLDARKHHRKVGTALKRLSDELGDEPSRTEVLGLLEEMLHYDPERRPTAAELANQLQDLIGVASGPWLMRWAEAAIGAICAGPRTVQPEPASQDSSAVDSGISLSYLHSDPSPDAGHLSGSSKILTDHKGSTSTTTPLCAGSPSPTPLATETSWAEGPLQDLQAASGGREAPNTTLRTVLRLHPAFIGFMISVLTILSLSAFGTLWWLWPDNAASIQGPSPAAMLPMTETQTDAREPQEDRPIPPMPAADSNEAAEAPAQSPPIVATPRRPVVVATVIKEPDSAISTVLSSRAEPKPKSKSNADASDVGEVVPGPAPVPDQPTVTTVVLDSGTLTVSGPVDSVVLVEPGGGAWTNMSAIPPGTYELRVGFQSGRVVEVGTLKFSPGQAHSVRCNAEADRCQGDSLIQKATVSPEFFKLTNDLEDDITTKH